jgi:DNA modification methylase
MLETETDLLRTLRSGTYTLDELYALCESAIDVSRDNGHAAVSDRHRTDSVWKHRVRGWLANAKSKGLAERVDRATWLIQGTAENPSRLVLLNAGGDLAGVELRVQDAVALLRSLDEPADLVLCDPPYALGRGAGHFADGHGYRRDQTKVLDGYVDVDASAYAEFSYRWISAAAAILRNGGQAAIITGPQQACHVQYAAEQAGLTWVSQIVARKVFPLMTSRRPSCAHWCVTVMCRGPLTNSKRVFNTPADLPKAASGADYPLDWWDSNGRADRPGLLRYDNALPLPLVSRLVHAFSDPGELVIDPMLGSGTTPIAAHLAARRFIGGDLNPAAVRFAAARLLEEHLWPSWRHPTLFAA